MVDRRLFIKIGGMAIFALGSPRLVRSSFPNLFNPQRFLAFFNTHTFERLASLYWSAGEYKPTALERINHILRDFRTGESKSIDTGLLDLLYALRLKLKTEQPFHVISGYRSPATNTALREKGRGVAKNSLHMLGKAIDIRLPGIPLPDLRKAALDLKAGGVGYYSKSDFVHVDVGRVRCW